MLHIDQIGGSNDIKQQKLSASWCNVRPTKEEKTNKSGKKKKEEVHDRERSNTKPVVTEDTA